MDLQDALNLLPTAYSDDRGKYFVQIVWEETRTDSFSWRKESDTAILGAIGALARPIAPFAARLNISTQRALLRELPGLMRLAGTNYSVLRALEIFGYTAVIVENPEGVWGSFIVKIAQTFPLAEVAAIVNFFRPVGRLLTSIQNFEAILLDGSRFFDGATTLS